MKFGELVSCLVLLYHATEAAPNCTGKTDSDLKYSGCSMLMKVEWWNVAPYIYKPDPSSLEIKGIFKTVVEKVVKDCCGECVKFSYNLEAANNSETLKTNIGRNGSVLSFPVYGTMTHIKFQNKPYFPVVESPGVIYIQGMADAKNAAAAVVSAVLQGWPILVLTLIMAALSGIVMWALDSYWNPDQFPSSFFKGSWEGFWWAFVSMTTVGYGDRAPKSFIARVFAFFWVLVGLVIISIFTATVTTSLTALSLSNDITLYGSTIVALNNTEEQRYGVRNNADVQVVPTVEAFAQAIITKKINDKDVAGGLIDSYVAGFEKTKLAESRGLRVGTVFDHQFAYGFVISNTLATVDMERCLRRTLSTQESWITEEIQQQMTALPEPEKSAAEEKSSNLFDPTSDVFQQAVFSCLGIIVFLTILGIAWEYLYWRPKQKREQPEKTDPTRIVTPHTSFEELVAAQCQELEDAMITEVMAFYKAFNRKLEEIRKRHLRNDGLKGGLDDQKPQVLDLRSHSKMMKK